MQRLPTSIDFGILGNPKLRALYEDVEAITQNVGSGAFELPISGFDKQGNVSVLNDVVDVASNVDLQASLEIHAASESLSDFYGTGEDLKAPAGSSYADCALTLGGGASAQASTSTGPLQISATGSVNMGVDYRHLLLVKNTSTRLRALSDLLRTTRPPQAIELSKSALADGERHRLEGTLHLDFGLKLEAGKKFAFDKSVELFSGLPSAALTASGEMTLSAALGLSMYERMFIAIGRSDKWARVRLQRERERRIGFSAIMALQAQYDLGGGLANVLEQALGQSPIPRLTDSLRQVVDPMAAGDWEAIKGKLTGDLADAIGEFVDDTGWKDWLASSPEVAQLSSTSRKIVDFYDGIDPKVQSLWDQLLGKATLGPGSKIRSALDQLTQLDSPNFEIESLLTLSSDATEAVDLLETLSGKSLEEILLSSSDGIKDTLAEVAGLARKAETLFDLDNQVVGKIREFSDKTGITRTVDVLRKVQSKDDLEAVASERLQRLVERLAGKAWAQIRPADLTKIEDWAERTQKLLQGGEDLEAKILQKIRDVRGEIGFSLGLEISRVSTSAALLDFDIDLGSEEKFRNKVQQAIAGGSVSNVLNILAEKADEEDDGALPFQLRECAFTSRRVRTSSVAFVLSLLGPMGKFIQNQNGISRRLEESTVRVQQVGKQLRRSATYSGGFQRTETWNKTTSETALWLDVEAADLTKSMPRLDARFEKETSRSLRATYAREDSETSAAELEALKARLVDDLGFQGGDALQKIPALAQTRIALDIRLPGAALSAYCNGVEKQKDWDAFYLGGAQLWFNDHLVDKRFDDVILGSVLSVFVNTDKFVDNWKKGVRDFGKALSSAGKGKEFPIPVAGRNIKVQPVLDVAGTGMPRFNPDFDPIRELVSRRKPGFNKIARLRKALAAAGASRTPAAYGDATRAFADGWKAATACSTSWPTPTFGMWLLMARLSQSDMQKFLREATGVATVRWKQGSDWQGPVTLRLEPGQGIKTPV